MLRQHGGKRFLLLHAGRASASASAQRRRSARELRERTACEYLIPIDTNARAASGDYAALNAGECFVPSRDPVRALHGFGCKRATVRNVALDIEPQLGDGRR